MMEMNWSRWFRCESSFGLLLVPSQPGVFALAEEVIESAGLNSRRMLAVLEVDETENLALSLSRLFAVGSRWREKLGEGRCFARYAVVPSLADRRTATEALRQWLHSQREMATQIFAGQGTQQPPVIHDDEDEEGTQVKTVAERAVDRVARSAYGKVLRTGS